MYFIPRPGSVIATFHIITTNSEPVNFVRGKLDVGTIGNFNVDRSTLAVDEFAFGKLNTSTV